MRLLAFLGLMAAAFAQPPFPLETLKVQGNTRLAAGKIIAVSGLKLGAPVVRKDFDDARARLLATGAFASVGCEFKPSPTNKGYDGLLEVTEEEQIYPYRFEELPVSDDEIRAALRQQEPLLGDDIPATKEVLDRYIATIQQLTGPTATVTGRLNADLPGKLMIVFRPNIPRYQIAEVKVKGNEVLPAPLLTRHLADVAIGTAFSETTFRLLLDSSLRPLYDARGRIRVSFPAIEMKNSTLNDGVVVTVTIDEGSSYSLKSIEFPGIARADAAEALKVSNIKPNDVANFDDINAGLEKVLAVYRGKGYLKAAAHLDREIDDKEHTVSVLAKLDSGPQFHMGKLEIVGLDMLTEPPVRKVWEIKPGAPFRPDYPDAFLNDLRTQGVFDNLGKTRAVSDIDEKSHTVNVTLYFTGAAPAPKKGRGGRGSPAF